MIVRDRGLLYYRLLKADVKEAKNIVCGSQKLLSEYTSPPKAVRIFPSTSTLHELYQFYLKSMLCWLTITTCKTFYRDSVKQ